MRPGRDMSAMIPRHAAINSQDTLTLNTKDLYVRATHDIDVAGATDGSGNMNIQSY